MAYTLFPMDRARITAGSFLRSLLVIPLYKRATGPIARIAVIVSAVIVGAIPSCARPS